MRLRVTFFLLLLTTLVDVALGAKECDRIGLLGEFKSRTGRLSKPFGVQIRLGADAAIRFLKQERKSDRRCYSFELLDIDNSVANIPDIIESAKDIKIFVGLGLSDQALIARKALIKKSAVLFSPTASSNDLNLDGNRVIMMFPTNKQIAESMAVSAIERGLKSLVTIADPSSTYSSGMAQAFASAIQARGGKITESFQFKNGRTDIRALAMKLKNTNASNIFLPMFELDVAQLVSSFDRAGLRLSYIGTDAWGSQSNVILKLTKQVAFSAVLPSIYSSEVDSKMNKKFRMYYRKVGGIDDPMDLAAFSFESVLLMDQMRERCGDSLFFKNVEACLRMALPFESTTGRISNADRLNLKRNISIRMFEPPLESRRGT